MFQQEVEELFFLQTGAFIVTWWEVIAGVPSNPEAKLYFTVICLFKTAPALECFSPNISSTLCLLIRRVLLRLVARCLPFRESAS